MDLDRKIDSAILMCSYNDYGFDSKNLVKDQFISERNKGNIYLNNLILRNKSASLDNVKFNFLLDGIPIIAYSMMNLFKSKIKDISVIGNSDSGKIFDSFVNLYDVNSEYERFKFIYEGEDLSLSNTLKKGKNSLDLNVEDLTLLLPGDLPLFYNLDNSISDPAIFSHDCILNLNTKNGPGRFFPRNYHLNVSERDIIHQIKEPNFYLLNLNKVNFGILDTFYGGRKTYSNFDSGKCFQEKGRSYLIKERFLKSGKWKKTLSSLKGNYSSFFLPLIFSNSPTLEVNALEDLISQGIGLKSKINLDNKDPGTIEDVDSLEDWAYLNQMFIKSKRDNSTRHKFYPHYKSLNKFKTGPMNNLREEVSLYNNFEEYINYLFEDFGLVKDSYYQDGDSFLSDVPYKSNNLSFDFTKYFVKDMLENNLRYHKIFFDKLS